MTPRTFGTILCIVTCFVSLRNNKTSVIYFSWTPEYTKLYWKKKTKDQLYYIEDLFNQTHIIIVMCVKAVSQYKYVWSFKARSVTFYNHKFISFINKNNLRHFINDVDKTFNRLWHVKMVLTRLHPYKFHWH